MNTLKMIIIIVGILLCWRFQLYRLLSILLVGFTTVVVGLVYVQFTSDYSIAILFPWRASIYLVPLSAIVIIAAAVLIQTALLKDYLLGQSLFQIILWTFLLVILVGEAGLFLKWKIISPPNYESSPIYIGIADATTPSDVILTPLDEDSNVLSSRFWSKARLGIERAIYVDVISTPMLGYEVSEYWKRMQFVRSFYQQNLETQLVLCHDANVDFFVSYDTDTSLDIAPIFEFDPVYLYSCK